ncbi:MAG: hypothetical protein BWK76_24630 [Desulfobulbaceae bacterium A2]|nr:MAG: hypothetical protein BWK76_24630 [Desulfobulbaceae bacterium A2]
MPNARLAVARRVAQLCGRRTLVLGALIVLGLLPTNPLLSSAATRCTRTAPLTAFDQALLDEVNLARTAPGNYAALLRERYADLDQKGRLLRDGTRYTMREGRKAVDEAVRFLTAAAPVAPLRLSSCLALAARDHVADHGAAGKMGHVGSNGSQPSDRASRYLSERGVCGENIAFGFRTPRDVVMQLIVDDGVPSRGHRTNLFKSGYKTLGVATGPHAKFSSMTVLLLCLHDIDE